MCNVTGDLGGYMGLLLGASVITVVEVLDLIIYHLLKRNKSRKPSSTETRERCDGSSHDSREVFVTTGSRERMRGTGTKLNDSVVYMGEICAEGGDVCSTVQEHFRSDPRTLPLGFNDMTHVAGIQDEENQVTKF